MDRFAYVSSASSHFHLTFQDVLFCLELANMTTCQSINVYPHTFLRILTFSWHVQAPFNLYAFYCIVFLSPKAMNTFRFDLMVLYTKLLPISQVALVRLPILLDISGLHVFNGPHTCCNTRHDFWILCWAL